MRDAARTDDPASEKCLQCLRSLRISLASKPVSWVKLFGDAGLNEVIRVLNDVSSHRAPNKVQRDIQLECVKCLKAFMNNKFGLEAGLQAETTLIPLARALNPESPQVMMEVMKLMMAASVYQGG